MIHPVDALLKPQISVVVPTCNRPELLKRALASVLAQTFQDFEIIVVDDGVQSAAEVTASFGDARIRYIKNDGAHGGGAARNRGIEAAKGEFIAFLDDDDQWMPEKLQKQVALLKNAGPKTAFCFSAVVNIRDNGKEVTHVPEGETNFLERALTRFSGFLTSTLVVKRDALLAVGGFDESFPAGQEPDLIIRLSEKYDGIGINEPLVTMSMEGSYEHIGSSPARLIVGRGMLIAKHAALFVSRPRLLAKHYFRIGLAYRDSGNVKEARRFFLKAFIFSYNPRYLFHVFASHL